MYSQMIVNADGEPLGIDYFYDDEPADVSPFSDYGLLYGDDYDGYVDPPNCPGHATSDETSGDASEQSDGSWVCDIGPCPAESPADEPADESEYKTPKGRRPDPLPAVFVGMAVTDEEGLQIRVTHVIGPVIVGWVENESMLFGYPPREVERLIGYVFPANRPDLKRY